jgi:hypothetical protein
MAQEEPTNDRFAGTGLGLSYIGKDHCYAYSGAVALDGTTNENTYLEFTSGSGFIVCNFQANNMDTGAGTDDMFYQIYFNGTVIMAYLVGGSKGYSEPDNLVPLIIPPFTNVKCTVKDTTQASAIKNTLSITGRVYGAE